MLEKLNHVERRELDDWVQTPQSRERGGIDLMRGPGWNKAALHMQTEMRASWEQALDVTERVKSRGNE
ncbi:hypothetical protein G0D86_29745 (plasmid) [Burkholderia multivorans]|uniref:hypothetical protein n=1 Tax=Burkholderia multivorans TaxID=87883 RepID=UPI0019D1EC85|nr:hypothetical protein [Burkholderia multivorans]QSL63973.1 hypothetical protein G0D86_29745 [Burkholderia multivorans]